MFGRYRRLVPKEHRDLIRRHRLPKPNWYVGSAERPFIPDAQFRADVERLKATLAETRARRLSATDREGTG